MNLFRRTFRTESGMCGRELIDWKVHQGNLHELACAFLDKGDFGSVFWPDDQASEFYNELQYSVHHETIKDTIQQLFFRLNRQESNNIKYKGKRKLQADKDVEQGPPKVSSIATQPVKRQKVALENSKVPAPTERPAHTTGKKRVAALSFKISGPGLKIEQMLRDGEEERFEHTKAFINEKVQELYNDRFKSIPIFRIEVEPIQT
ncbi:hypothetical protein UCRPA7_1847 [Phaeoacremonium minimum UCRPA7]|uniref:Uncharacterized protein n=1 Tax=Phaeoacremonium minimum (strain UCR-PA7) TaxID=1286976 RepID=R8BTL2_PHAM7|nr:hypothetical protein UCRPA7_1847 [Phaeoacremonium minimum UCRPA7]EOO02644.1 hypothetical protein UCRPA7_1847 [Phaeoacremonium minimum UCRPA7]